MNSAPPGTTGNLLPHEALDDRQVAEALRLGQNGLLEMIAKGAPLADTLSELMRLIEAQSDRLLCSVMLLDEDGVHIHPGAGPSLPVSYLAALDGIEVGPEAGSCGTSMFRRQPVIVTDIERDPLWAPYRHLVLPHGLRACWSTPICMDGDVMVGSFALYYREVRAPGELEAALVAVATHVASIAIARHRHETELARHRFHLEELVAQRTAELNAAKERAEHSNHALSLANQQLAGALRSLSDTQEELLRRDKLAALGALVAGVAHELNTPIGNCLTVASTLADLARRFANDYGQGLTRVKVEDFIRDTNNAGDILLRNLQRAADLVASFKQVAVEQASAPRRSFQLAQMASAARLNYQATSASVHHDIADDIQLDSYPGPLAEVLVTLVNNALLHGYRGGAGLVVVSARPVDGEQVEIGVEDQGAGIAQSHLKHIFDPFFTTTLGQGGSGLGLYIAHNIVTGILGGSIQVNSQLSRGTRFVLRLPLQAPEFHHQRAPA